MQVRKALYTIAAAIMIQALPAVAQDDSLVTQVETAMVRATRYMMDKVSTRGGFVWYYRPDLSRRWGEMEAYKSMVWVQDGGTVSVGHMLLDAYRSTGNGYFYKMAKRVAAALVAGQSKEGGWNYMIDFAGPKSMERWYNTIGKNGWRLEEFQHYYGNDTYDDDVSSDAARFFLRIYLEKHDKRYKLVLDKAINFLLRSQYPAGGWPQRFPLKYDFKKAGHPDYTSYYTFNDDVSWENTNFLIQCYTTLGDKRLLEAIHRGMNFYLVSQQPNGAWGQQYDMQLKPAGARTYEPTAYLPRATYTNAMLLLKFYQFTGDKKFLEPVPKAISWLEQSKLPVELTENGRYTHPLFIEPATGKPIFVHRKGSNVTFGHYYVDYNDSKLLSHMRGKGSININSLQREYERVAALPADLVTQDSPLKTFDPKALMAHPAVLNRYQQSESIPASRVEEILAALDGKNRWLVKHVMISHPYVGDGKKQDQTDEYASTNVGDATDTSPFADPSDQEYISTPEYIKNMYQLMNFVKNQRPAGRGR